MVEAPEQKEKEEKGGQELLEEEEYVDFSRWLYDYSSNLHWYNEKQKEHTSREGLPARPVCRHLYQTFTLEVDMLESYSLVRPDQVADLAEAPQGVPVIKSFYRIVVLWKEVWAFQLDILFPQRVIVNESCHNPIENTCNHKSDGTSDSQNARLSADIQVRHLSRAELHQLRMVVDPV